MCASRTRRAISCAYWAPKSTTRTGRRWAGGLTASWLTSVSLPARRARKPVRGDSGVRPTVRQVRSLPLADPGTPDLRSPGRYLWWVAGGQWLGLLGGMSCGILWMSGQAVVPALLGRAIDTGVAAKDVGAL